MISFLLSLGLGILSFIGLVIIDAVYNSKKVFGHILFIALGLLSGYLFALIGSPWAYLIILFIAFGHGSSSAIKNITSHDRRVTAIEFGAIAILMYLLLAAQYCSGDVCTSIIKH